MSRVRCLPLAYSPDGAVYYRRLRHLRWPAWLDSGQPGVSGGRFDIIAADPAVRLVAGADGPAMVGQPGDPNGDLFSLLRAQLGRPEPGPPDVPFCGGALGFVGYEANRAAFGLLPRPNVLGWPDAAIGLYDWAVIVDHATRRACIADSGRARRGERQVTVDEVAALLRGACGSADPLAPVGPVRGELRVDGMSRDDYGLAFARIQGYIRAGDCYQVNLAQRFQARIPQDPYAVYRAMRQANPAPFGALLEYPFGSVLSASPERFLALDGGHVRTDPIKGTRPRGQSADADRALARELAASAKDRAENVMIVDLLRNDLGRVCVPGSIAVPRLFAVERFATVHHLVSTVTGRLRGDRDAVDLLAACFPGGSVTGAPKRRAMEIIDELETHRRDPYCGSIIRLGYDGNLDSNIAIRTLLMIGADAWYWAGGGIVYDSQVDAEYQECLDKALAFRRLLGA
jgi:para-aminobenzoate synthetase component I